MKLQLKKITAAAFTIVTLSAMVACNDSNDRSNTGHTATDSSVTDTRRYSAPDTTNYITNDSNFTDASPRSGTGIGQDNK